MGESGVNNANNTSVVTVNVYASNTAGYTYWNYNGATISVSCDGQVQNFTIASVNCGVGDTHLGSRSFTITHNADGSKSVGASAIFYTGVVGNLSASGSLRLTNIPRATTPTLTYADSQKRLGTVLTINCPRASSSFTHTVKYTFGNLIGTIASNVATSTAWTLPVALANQIPNSVTGTGRITVETYSGSTKIGSKDINFNIQIADNMLPTFTSVTATKVDNGVPSSFGVYVESISKAALTINGATGSYGSTIKEYSISGAGVSSDKVSDTLGPFHTNGTVVFTATITDSRGRKASKTVSITIYEYNVPTLALVASRCNSAGTETPTGTYIAITPTYSVASVNGKNAVASKRFEIVGTSYVNTACASGNKCVLGAGTIALNKEYEVKGTIIDTIGNPASITVIIKIADAIWNVKSNGKGMAIGSYATEDNVLKVDWVLKANVGIEAKGKEVSVEGHLHDDEYLKLTGGKLTGDLVLPSLQVENNISTPKFIYAGDVLYTNDNNYRILWCKNDIYNMMWGNSTHTYFHYNTNAGAFGVNCWLSDKSLKERIHDTRITEALNKISQFKHVEFDWKNADEHTYLGYVADDVEKILPCLIHKVEQYDKDNKPNGQFLKQIDHTTLIPLITMGMQELTYENELLWTFNNQVVDEFEKRDKLIADLTARIEKLENGN